MKWTDLSFHLRTTFHSTLLSINCPVAQLLRSSSCQSTLISSASTQENGRFILQWKLRVTKGKGASCPSEKYSTIYLINNNKIFVSQTSPCWDLNIKELRTRDSFRVLGSDYGWEKGWFRHSFRNGTVISVFTKHVCRIICKCLGWSSLRK